MISVRKSMIGIGSFGKECFSHYQDYNASDVMYEEVGEIFIVNNGTKDIGMFTVHINDYYTEIYPLVWMHPKSCKMGLLQVIKVAAYYCYMKAIEQNIESVIVRIKDLLSAKSICKIAEGFKYYILSERNILCFCDIKKINKENYIKLSDSFELDL